MKIQVNSDNTINVDASLMLVVKDEAKRVLDRFAKELTRVEIHLSDIDNKKTGPVDKRCLIEVRPAGDRPLVASAVAATAESAVDEALKKMKRQLTTFFGKKGRPAAQISTPAPKAKRTGVAPTKSKVKETGAKKAAAKKPTKLSPRGPKKKGIYQARRKGWPR